MKNPLPINIRCVCIEEYVKMQELHEWYRKQKSEGEILSIYTGADESLRGRYAAVDALLDKRFGKFPKAVELPEKPLDLDEARAIGSAYAEQEEPLVHEDEAVPDFTPATEPSNFFESKFEDPVIPETEAEAEFIDDPTTAGF